MSQRKTTWKRIFGLLLLTGWLTLSSQSAQAQESRSVRDAAWSRGYVIHGKIPGFVPFIFEGDSTCSLETAAAYFGMQNVILRLAGKGIAPRAGPMGQAVFGLAVPDGDRARVSDQIIAPLIRQRASS